MNQILLGLSIPYIISAIIYIVRGRRASFRMLILSPTLMLTGSLWAIAPDIPRLLRMDVLYDQLSRDPRCNIFFWHYSIDQAESYSPWFTVGFVLILASLLIVAWRELRLTEEG